MVFKAFFELAMYLRQRPMGIFDLAAPGPQGTEPGVGAKLQRYRLLLARNRNRLVQTGFRLAVSRVDPFPASPEQFAFPAPAVGLERAVAGARDDGQRLFDRHERFLIGLAAGERG